MASVKSEEVACSFCLEYGRSSTRLRSLPCGHHYCEPCLDTKFETNKVVRCVKCSTVYDTNLNLLPPADQAGGLTAVWCGICLKKGDTNKAQTYCTTCTKCFCDKHKESHDDLHDDHKKISVEDYQLQSRKLEARKCTKHINQVLVSGCRSCLGVFCIKCMTENTQCTGKTGHSMHMLEELVRIIESEYESMKGSVSGMDGVLSDLSNKCYIIIDEQNEETDKMIKLLHKTRDAQIASIKTKYANLERIFTSTRDSSVQKIEDFLTLQVDGLLSDMRRELKLMEARLKDNHQVDIISGYRGIRDLVQTLTAQRFLRLRVENMDVLEKNGTFRSPELKQSPKSFQIEAELLPLVRSPCAAAVIPGSLTMIKQIPTRNECSTVCGSADHVFVAQSSGHLMSILPEFNALEFEVIAKAGPFIGLGVIDSYLLIVEKGKRDNIVHVSDLKSGREVTSWKHEDTNHEMASNLAVVGQHIVMIAKNKDGGGELTVSAVNGSTIRHFPCNLIGHHWVSICSGVEETIILSDYISSKVHCIRIDSGNTLWTSSAVKKPLGVTCYKDKYVLVTNLSTGTFIWILDINTGNLLGTISDTSNVFKDKTVFSLYTYGNKLVVPRRGDKIVVFYRME